MICFWGFFSSLSLSLNAKPSHNMHVQRTCTKNSKWTAQPQGLLGVTDKVGGMYVRILHIRMWKVKENERGGPGGFSGRCNRKSDRMTFPGFFDYLALWVFCPCRLCYAWGFWCFLGMGAWNSHIWTRQRPYTLFTRCTNKPRQNQSHEKG